MKYITFLLLPLLLLNCSNNKTVYWCGDHACVNNKEKKIYFKKNTKWGFKFLSKLLKQRRPTRTLNRHFQCITLNRNLELY